MFEKKSSGGFPDLAHHLLVVGVFGHGHVVVSRWPAMGYDAFDGSAVTSWGCISSSLRSWLASSLVLVCAF